MVLPENDTGLRSSQKSEGRSKRRALAVRTISVASPSSYIPCGGYADYHQGPASAIPALRVYLEIPRDGSASVEEVKREAAARFPIASKAGKLTLDVYTSGEPFILCLHMYTCPPPSKPHFDRGF